MGYSCNPKPDPVSLPYRKRLLFFTFIVLLLGFGLACNLGLFGGRDDRASPVGEDDDSIVSVSPPHDSSTVDETATSTPPSEPIEATKEVQPEVTEKPTSTPTAEPTSIKANLADEQVLILSGTRPLTLDPHLSGDAASNEYVVEIFSGLMAFDPDLNLIPDTAESYEISKDGLVYTFKIRPEARFQDGKPVRAEDFKWSFERACDPATGSHTADTYLGDIVGCRDKLRGKAGEVEGVVVVDDLTLQLTIDEPKGFFLAKMAYSTAYVLDRENVRSGGPVWFRWPNGSGPFRLEEYVPGQMVIVLKRNDNYYREPKPVLEQVRYLIDAPIDLMTGYEEDLSTLSRDGVGVSYGAIQVPPSSLSRVTDPNNPLRQELVSVNVLSVDYIGFNVNKPPFDDVNIRRAFNLALDKRSIVKSIQGDVYVANGIVPVSMPGYQNPDLSDYEFDLEHALDLIAQSSYGDVSQLPAITLNTSETGNVGIAIAKSYEMNLGLKIAVEKVPWSELINNLNRPDMPYQMYWIGWVADYPDPQNFLEILFHSESSQNYGGYSNPTVDDLLNEARGTQNVRERLALYRQVEQFILDDAAWIPLYFKIENWLVKPYVQNFRIPPIKAPKFQYVFIAEH
jgi:oligopeptide transport system substrate-binding protein